MSSVKELEETLQELTLKRQSVQDELNYARDAIKVREDTLNPPDATDE